MGALILKYENAVFSSTEGDTYYRFIISILPALVVASFIYLLGPEVYRPAFAIFLTFYFGVAVGWIAAPAIGIAGGLHPLSVILLLVFISSQSSLIVSANYPLLEKIPYFGRYVKKIRTKAGELIERKDYGKNIGLVTIFWLRFLPIYGTGPNVMTLVGMILDLEWKRVWLTITLSALTRFSLVTAFVYYGYLNI